MRLKRLTARAVTLSGLLTRPMTLGVRVLVRMAGDRVLLVRHSYVPGWYLPGGGVGGGETLRAAAERELLEETGYRPAAPPRLFGVYLNAAVSRRDHVALFVAEAEAPTVPRRPGGEIAAVADFALDDLPEETTVATRRRIAEVVAGAPAAEIW